MEVTAEDIEFVTKKGSDLLDSLKAKKGPFLSRIAEFIAKTGVNFDYVFVGNKYFFFVEISNTGCEIIKYNIFGIPPNYNKIVFNMFKKFSAKFLYFPESVYEFTDTEIRILCYNKDCLHMHEMRYAKNYKAHVDIIGRFLSERKITCTDFVINIGSTSAHFGNIRLRITNKLTLYSIAKLADNHPIIDEVLKSQFAERFLKGDLNHWIDCGDTGITIIKGQKYISTAI
jgi:hypothetical protein